MADDAESRLLGELREVRPGLFRLDGVLVTAKAAEVMERSGALPSDLVKRYGRDMSGPGRPGLIGYSLLDERELPSSETSVHVSFDPELSEVVIWEEW